MRMEMKTANLRFEIPRFFNGNANFRVEPKVNDNGVRKGVFSDLGGNAKRETFSEANIGEIGQDTCL